MRIGLLDTLHHLLWVCSARSGRLGSQVGEHYSASGCETRCRFSHSEGGVRRRRASAELFELRLECISTAPSSAYGQYLVRGHTHHHFSSSAPKSSARTKTGKNFSRDAQSAVTNSFESSEPEQGQEQPIEEEKLRLSKHPYNYLSGTATDSDTVTSGTPFYQAFEHGALGQQPFATMVANRVFISTPLHGSVFKRKDTIKYIVLHSTETASPADAKRVIQSWNNRGLRHPGAQFVVDRDGAIYATANPDLATVHINTKKTSAEYSNDNSVGIEIVRAGKQRYTQPQLNSVMYLVSYLQQHYQVPDQNVTTHHRVQPSDRSDPVGFDLLAFSRTKSDFENQAIVWSGAHFVTATKTTVASAPDDFVTQSVPYDGGGPTTKANHRAKSFVAPASKMNRKGDRSHRDAQSIAAVPSSARRFNSSVTSGQFNLRRRAASDVVASRSNSTSRGSSASLTRGSNVRRHSTADSPISYSSSHKRVAVSASSVHQISRHYTSAELVTTWHVSSHHFRGEGEVTSGSGSRRVASIVGSVQSGTQISFASTACEPHRLGGFSST